MTTLSYHIPVMIDETLRFLSPKEGGTYIDATLGGGGHAKAIMESISGKGRLIGFDMDADAIAGSETVLKGRGKAVTLINDNFRNIKAALSGMNISGIDGILFDLGVSSRQIDRGEKGMSLRFEGPLDMRMDSRSSASASDIVNGWQKGDIAKVIFDFGEEPLSRKIASGIERARQSREISTTTELLEVIRSSLRGLPPKRINDAATRTFQALRIAVNDELENLKAALANALDLLKEDGRMVVISYHSLEDRIVKKFFRLEASACVCDPRVPKCVCDHKKRLDVLTRKPVLPSPAEIKANPRARSAKLRAAVRLPS